VAFKGVEGVRGSKPRDPPGGEMRREGKFLRNDVHHADAVVWEPV
jgi:hypothetical protein